MAAQSAFLDGVAPPGWKLRGDPFCVQTATADMDPFGFRDFPPMEHGFRSAMRTDEWHAPRNPGD